MAEVLLHAYTPLLIWTGLGLLLGPWLPHSWPRLVGRSLYWVGVPLEVFSLARHTNFSGQMGLAPAGAALAVVLGALLSLASLHYLMRSGLRVDMSPDRPAGGLWGRYGFGKFATAIAFSTSPVLAPMVTNLEANLGADCGANLAIDPAQAPETAPWWTEPAARGSYILSAMLGNAGFVGLAIAPLFLDASSAGFPAFYAVSQNVMGTYGLGVWVASTFGTTGGDRSLWGQVKTMAAVPSLWGFGFGVASQPIALPPWIETLSHGSVGLVIPTAFVLMGIRLSQLKGWDCLRVAAVPALLKTIAVPALLGLGAIMIGIDPQLRLGLVLMSGMPTAFACLILAEEYDLDRSMIATSIALTTVLVLLAIPMWLKLFG
ncbi:MAG: AEC family transporter [Limnothrix sp. CACIAM 69d]|nr:MAG: AEC family transporter [Limnothrix sp. CACIAM 69d]